MHMQVERILLSSHIIGSVIDAHDLVLVNLVLDKRNSCSLGFSKGHLVKIVFLVQNLAKCEIFESRKEILSHGLAQAQNQTIP